MKKIRVLAPITWFLLLKIFQWKRSISLFVGADNRSGLALFLLAHGDRRHRRNPESLCLHTLVLCSQCRSLHPPGECYLVDQTFIDPRKEVAAYRRVVLPSRA